MGAGPSLVSRLAEAAAAAEREADRARDAAAAAEQAAGAARQAADEGAATAHGHAEELRRISRYESNAVAAAAPAPAGNGVPAAPAAPHSPVDPSDARPADPALKPMEMDRKPLLAPKKTAPKREPREGFDDAKNPMAMIALDGHFREINQAFSDLVGYGEAEFQQAIWPPVMDRANLDTHREQMKDMLAGKIESAGIKTGYVHAQGLLVPIVGTLTLVRENGEPSHFLLETS